MKYWYFFCEFLVFASGFLFGCGSLLFAFLLLFIAALIGRFKFKSEPLSTN